LIDATTGTTSGQFEYGPFGETIRLTPNANNLSPFRFSTKYSDDESDFLYYGFRYYNPSTGMWLSRDPIEEKGGLNLYAFVKNVPTSGIDRLGLAFYLENPANIAPPCKYCKVTKGPDYSPNGTINATANPDGTKSASFILSAEFKNSIGWIKSASASCCEVRQYVKWESEQVRPQNPVFEPASDYPPDKWVEDRHISGARIGYRSGPYHNQIYSGAYTDNAFYGYESPLDVSGSKKGWWKFQLKVVDVCNDGKVVATSPELTLQW